MSIPPSNRAENNELFVLTTGQMVDTLKSGKIARSNENTFVYRQPYGFIWCEEDGSYPCNKYFQINDLTLKLRWTIQEID